MFKAARKINLILFILAATFIFAGCDLNDPNKVGDCGLNVAFVDVPEEFKTLDERVTDNFYICVVIENMVTGKNYNIILDKANEYSYTAMLYPGSYHVISVLSSNAGVIGATLAADSESVELTKEDTKSLGVYIENREEFISSCDLFLASGEMATYDKFSGKVMIEGSVYDIAELPNVLDLTGEITVKPYGRGEYKDEVRGITLTMLNDTSEEKPYTECRVISVEVTKRTAVFPGCVAVGVSGEYVSNRDSGVYGQPSSFEGIGLLGYGYGSCDCVYKDTALGNKITISISDVGRYVTSIKYETERYE